MAVKSQNTTSIPVEYTELAGFANHDPKKWDLEDEIRDKYQNELDKAIFDQKTPELDEFSSDEAKKGFQAAINTQNPPESPSKPTFSDLLSALISDLHRVRNHVIPAYYAQYYDQNTDPGTRAGIVHALHIINGTVSAAEHAMLDRDVSAVLAALHQLGSFGFTKGDDDGGPE